MPVREDDRSVSDDQLLIRAIWDSPDACPKSEDGTYRPSSAAFIDRRSFELSVFVADLTTEAEMAKKFPCYGLVTLPAGVPRSLGYIISKTPEYEEDGPAHRVICQGETPAKQVKKDAKTMALQSTWLLLPDSVRKQVT
jgi:hypothetical protein